MKFPLCKEGIGLEAISDRAVKIGVRVGTHQWQRSVKNTRAAGIFGYFFTWYPVLVARLEAVFQASGRVVLKSRVRS